MKHSTPIRTYSNTPHHAEHTVEVRHCVVCGSTASKPYWDLQTYRYRICTTCRHVFQSPAPDPAALHNRYQDDYYNYEVQNSTNFLNLMLQGLADSQVLQLLDQPPHSTPNHQPPPRTILDIGCATGALLNHFKQHGWRTHGVEICKPAATYGRHHYGVDIFIGDVADAPLPAASCGLIHSSHVIEHIADSNRFIHTICSLLHPHGYVVLVTPNLDSFQAQLMRSRWRSAIADHLHLFRYATLRRLLNAHGLRVVKKCSWGGIAAGITLPPLKRIADRAAKLLNCGDVMLVVAQKR